MNTGLSHMNTVEGRKEAITMATKWGIVHRELGLAGNIKYQTEN